MENKRNITWVDSLKGIAMCGVVMIHAGGAVLPSFLGRIGNIGKNGVQLFFVISVYLAYSSLDRVYSKDDKRFDINKLKTWWLGKFLKLMPLYYMAIFLYTVIEGGNKGWLGNEGHVTVKNILAHMLFLHGLVPHYSNSILGVEWYLGVLAIFYFCVPFLHKIVNSFEKSVLAFTVVAFACPVINTFAHSLCVDKAEAEIYLSYIGTFWIFAQLAVIMFGIIVYYIVKSNALAAIKQKRILSYTLLIFASAMIVGQAYDKNILFIIGKLPLFAVWFGMIIVSQSLCSCRLVDNVVFQQIGKYSYSIYLFHFILIHLYDRFIPLHVGNDIINWGIKYCIVIFVSYLISLALNRFFDVPLNRWLIHKLN